MTKRTGVTFTSTQEQNTGIVGQTIIVELPHEHTEFTTHAYGYTATYRLLCAKIEEVGEQGKVVRLSFISPKTHKKVVQWYEIDKIKFLDRVQEDR